MSNDYKKKEPTKNEKMIYELYMQLQSIDRSLFTNSALLISLAMNAGIKPERLAEMLINENDKIKEYSVKLNEEIGKLEKEKHKEHDHSHEGHEHHEHEHTEEAQKTEENQ